MSEVENVVKELEAVVEAKKTEVVKEAGKIAGEVEALPGEALGEIKKVEGEVVAEVKKEEEKVRTEITDAEKLMLTKMENEFLKAQMEFNRLQSVLKNIQDTYPKKIEELAVKYSADVKDWFFDGVELVFKKKPTQPAVK